VRPAKPLIRKQATQADTWCPWVGSGWVKPFPLPWLGSSLHTRAGLVDQTVRG
tara:strand:- start:1281 stop:1439 length:159 start_codon:yes stop_codon:yes gene_type:complete